MKKKKSPPASRDLNLPALRQFLRGYLHEDWTEEYDSAAEAARQFCEDADAEERAQVAAEWKAFCAQAKGMSLSAVNRLLSGQLGAAWNVRSTDELESVSQVFET